MNSLERRVNGLERSLDEMSHDLAISTRKISNTNDAGNTCCMLPGAEFLSPKFWRKADGPNASSKVPFSNRCQSLDYATKKHQVGNMSALDLTGDMQKQSRGQPWDHTQKAGSVR